MAKARLSGGMVLSLASRIMQGKIVPARWTKTLNVPLADWQIGRLADPVHNAFNNA